MVLSDLGSFVQTQVLSGIADHCGILGSLAFPLPEAFIIERRVFQYSKARWKDLQNAIRVIDWTEVIKEDDADGSAKRFEERLFGLICDHIPNVVIKDIKSNHEWLDDECRKLIRLKREAWGTSSFVQCRDECTQGLLSAYYRFLYRTRRKLTKLRPSSREWWRISRALMSAGKSSDVIPPLQRADGSWAMTAQEKADLLADTFEKKCQLDDMEINDFTDILDDHLENQPRLFVQIR